MATDHEVFVIAGQSGSKSTFVGGLQHHADQAKHLNIVPTPMEGDIDDDYYDGIVKQMTTRRKYPKQTKNGYVIELELDYGSTMMTNTKFNFVDIPGEQIDVVLSRVKEDIEDGDLDESSVSDEFESVKSKMGGDRAIQLEEWVTLFKYYYTQATKVVFLLNINKVIIENQDLLMTNKFVRTVIENKVKVAVVPTAVDLISYDPEEDPVWEQKAGLSTRIYDKALEEHIEERISRGDTPKLRQVLDLVKSNEGIDFFSVCVPAKSPGSDELKPVEGSGFETQGFTTMVNWLNDQSPRTNSSGFFSEVLQWLKS